MDDRVYLVYTALDNYTDPDAEVFIEYIGVAMSEEKAQQYVDNYVPEGSGWTHDERYPGEWQGEWISEGYFKTRRAATLTVGYEPLLVL